MKNRNYLLSFVILLYAETVLTVPINIVLVEDEEEQISKSAVGRGIKSVNGTKIDLTIATVTEFTNADKLCELIFKKDKKPTLVIDSIRQNYFEQNKLSDSLRLLLRKMGVPTISFSPSLLPWPGPPLTVIEKQFLIHIIPPELIMSQIVKSIMSIIGARKIAVFFETSTFAVVKNKAGLLFDNIASEIMMEEIDYDATMGLSLEKAAAAGITNFFVLASEEMAKAILIEASEYYQGLLNKENAWFVLTKDETKLVNNDFKSNVKVMLLQPTVFNKNNLNQVESTNISNKIEYGFYFDFFQHLSKILHKNVGVEEGWPETLSFPSCGKSTPDENNTSRENIKLRELLEEMQDSGNLNGTFGNFVIKNKQSRKPFGRQDITMKISMVTYKNGKSEIKDELQWQYSELKQPEDQFIGKTDILKQFKGDPLIRIITKHNPPFVYATVKNGKVVFDGLCIDLLEIIRKESNFTFQYEITTTDYINNGVLTQNEFLDSLITELVNGRADLAIGPIPVMPKWNLRVDFTVPFYDLVGFSILMKRKKVKTGFFRFLIVLDNNVWICILIAYFITSFMLFFFDKLNAYKFHNDHHKKKYKDEDKDEERNFSFMESFWYSLILVTPQGGGDPPKKLSSRLLSETWWLFGFVVITGFSANMAAFLTVSRFDNTIENLDDLVNQHKIAYKTVKYSLAHRYFKEMNAFEEQFKYIWTDLSLDLSFNETERANLAVWEYPIPDRYSKIWSNVNVKAPKNLQEGIFKTLNSDEEKGYAFIVLTYIKESLS